MPHPIFSRKGWIVRPLSRTMTPNVCRRCADAWTGRVFGLSKRPGIKVLPVKLQHTRAPVGIITLKNRTLSPVAQLFLETAREVARPLARRKW